MLETIVKAVVLSSLHKVYPDYCPDSYGVESFSALRNEPLSFQFAYKLSSPKAHKCPFYIRVESELPVTAYSVGYVPVLHAEKLQDDEHRGPGLYPDMLIPKKVDAVIDDEQDFWCHFQFERDEKNNLIAFNDCWQSIWFTVNEDSKTIAAGNYTVTLKLYSRIGNKFMGENTVSVEIIDAKLPKQQLINTNWFHCDCLADIYNVELFSDRFFEIMRSYVSLASKTGMNMIMLPAFTPPLDTPFGRERKTAQLVKVEVNDGEYSFDFSLMGKYINLCRECGIENFEHSHLFTQWGAKYAPKIMASVDGEYKRIFGWETDSGCREYADFLKCYLKALKVFLHEMNLDRHIMFHISDEPPKTLISFYENAVSVVADELKEYVCSDALSDFDFYKKGYTKRPIAAVNSPDIDEFIANCDDYWVYYTCGELTDNSPNRTISVPSARNRVLGLQMYVSGAKGFLHWGYNYYYGALSRGIFNPMINPCGYKQFAGASYIVYPDITGEALPSIRMKVFYEAIIDYGALQLLEALTGRDAVLRFIEKNAGKVDYKYSPTNQELFEFRQKLNSEIKKLVTEEAL